MRYAVAGLISLLIVAGGFGYYRHMERSIKALIRSQFEAEGVAVPPEVAAELDSEKPAKAALLGYGTELPGHIVLKITLGDILRKYAVCLIVFVCGVSFGIAHWMSPKAGHQESQP
jgi:hypothetical protein